MFQHIISCHLQTYVASYSQCKISGAEQGSLYHGTVTPPFLSTSASSHCQLSTCKIVVELWNLLYSQFSHRGKTRHEGMPKYIVHASCGPRGLNTREGHLLNSKAAPIQLDTHTPNASINIIRATNRVAPCFCQECLFLVCSIHICTSHFTHSRRFGSAVHVHL